MVALDNLGRDVSAFSQQTKDKESQRDDLTHTWQRQLIFFDAANTSS